MAHRRFRPKALSPGFPSPESHIAGRSTSLWSIAGDLFKCSIAGLQNPAVGSSDVWRCPKTPDARRTGGRMAPHGAGARYLPSRPPHPTKEKTGTRASPQSKTFLRGFSPSFLLLLLLRPRLRLPAAVLGTTPEGGQRRTPRTKAVPEQLDRRRPLGPRQQADVCVPATRRGD